jgi:hypothetical protein
MNEDTKLKEYTEKWQSVKLSENARAKMEGELLSYARFHAVREEGESRSIGQVPQGAFLQRLKFTTMPIALFLAVFVSVGTSFAAQGAVPGDFLYPVKTEVNENIRGAVAIGANAEARLQADLLAERLEEAEKLHAEGKLQADTAVMVANNIRTQSNATNAAIAKSDSKVALDVNASLKGAVDQFILRVGTDSVLATDIATSLNATSESKGTISTEAFIQDMKLRVSTLRTVIAKHEAKLSAEVKAELNAKLDSAALLTTEAEGKTEAEAQATLNKAATLAGEVEAKLSTLGQATVDGNTGIITDIDFSIDPMIIDRGDGNSSSGTVTDPAEPQTGADLDLQLDTVIDGDAIDADVQGALEATSGLGL